jgi:hypothetical protein
VTATHATLKQLTEKIKENRCMDNLFLSCDLLRDLTEKKFNCCGAVRPNRKNATESACWLLLVGFSLDLHLDPQDGGSTFF